MIQLEGKAVKFQGEALYLREKIASLWNRLQIPEAARDHFNSLYCGFTSKIIKAVSFEVPLSEAGAILIGGIPLTHTVEK